VTTWGWRFGTEVQQLGWVGWRWLLLVVSGSDTVFKVLCGSGGSTRRPDRKPHKLSGAVQPRYDLKYLESKGIQVKPARNAVAGSGNYQSPVKERNEKSFDVTLSNLTIKTTAGAAGIAAAGATANCSSPVPSCAVERS